MACDDYTFFYYGKSYMITYQRLRNHTNKYHISFYCYKSPAEAKYILKNPQHFSAHDNKGIVDILEKSIP